MTPDEHAQAQALFLDAIKLPVEKRDAFVRQKANSKSILVEVRSLLKYHDEKTILPSSHQDETIAPSGMDATVELNTSDIPRVSQAPAISKLEIDRSPALTDRFAQSTNQLLRNRLITSTWVLSGMLLAITMIAAVFGDVVVARLMVRGITLSFLGAICWVLVKSYNLSNRWLRSVELLIVAIPLVELSLIQWFESTKILQENDAGSIEELRAIVFTATSLYIAIYGMFIPSNWRRTAVVTGTVSLLPTLVSIAHQSVYDYPSEVSWMHFANPTLATIMAVVATIGAGIVHRVRKEAEHAKYYGQYQLIEEIGRGGMGIVYLGKHQMLMRPAAIKLIHNNSAGSPQAIAQFEKEVQATATLSHWNTVQIYDYGTTDEGDFYCVMEYLKGATLQQRLNRQHTIDLESTMAIAMQLCDGLEEAHLKGMVHRDIKPANIFLADIGGFHDIVKILDFGLVITSDETRGDKENLVGGTPAYMSPEQIRGDVLDGRSDIYAIGCVLYECLLGVPPFQAFSTTQLISDQMFKMPNLKPLSKIDAALPALLEKCLAKDASNRFANVAQLRESCQQWTS